MKSVVFAALLATPFLALSAAHAGPAGDALTKCVADSTTGKERKELAQWIFAAMSAHPEIQPMSRVDEESRVEFDKRLANLTGRLVTETCSDEARAAVVAEGSASFEAAFTVLGRLAMQELMTEPSVRASMTNYTKYLDRAKFEAVFSKK
ncbi:MAG: hypothetical protein R3E56_11090 [Burkholderiaceae bacterium]